ncbi:MAG: symporter small accessory protein [Bacteroidales bacterium]|jgi:hypothetical protein
MFGIDDPGIWIAYLLIAACVVFAIIFSIKTWNQEDISDSE